MAWLAGGPRNVGLLFREQGKQRAQRCFPALFDFGLAFRATQSDSGAAEILRSFLKRSFLKRSLLKFQFVASGCFFKYAFTNGHTGTTFSWLKWA
jgi:hypothetical protein